MLGIFSLPVEITVLIADYLPSQDFFHFRQSCSEANNRTLSLFIKNYFRTRYVMIERRSLETLLMISRHTILGPSIHCLELCIDHLIELSDLDTEDRLVHSGESDSEEEEGPSSDGNGRDLQAYCRCLENQTYFQQSGLDIAYLTLAMERLPNCTEIILDNSTRPWGAGYLAKQTGVLPHRYISWLPDSIDFVKRAIQTLLEAAVTSRLPLQRLCITFSSLDDDDCVKPYMLALPAPCAVRVRTNLTSLTSLGLVVNSELDFWSDFSSDSDWAPRLVNFITLFSSLSRLELAFDPRDKHKRFPQISQLLHIPTLKELYLLDIECTEAELAELLLRHRETLRHIDLGDIEMIAREGSWGSLIRTIRDSLAVEYFAMEDCLIGHGSIRLASISIDGDWHGFTELIDSLMGMEVEVR